MLLNNHIIIFTRFPEPGQTKTRLIPVLGAEKAAELQRKMTEKTAGETSNLQTKLNLPVSVFYTGGSSRNISAWLGNSFIYQRQCGGNIGCRMADAFTRTFRHTSGSVILIGSDIPELTSAIVETAFTSLKTNDCVFGPSRDGGYYLIGINDKSSHHLVNILFDQMPWSTDKVLETSLQRVSDSELSYSLLKRLSDIDRPEDIDVAKKMGLL